jgi:hypothetical protein
MITRIKSWLFRRRIARAQRKSVTNEMWQRVLDMRRRELVELPLEARLIAAGMMAAADKR